MYLESLRLNRLQRKVLLLILAIMVVPMLGAATLASEWVSSGFEARLKHYIVDAARVDQTWLRAYQNDAVMFGGVLANDPAFLARLRSGDPNPVQPQLVHMAREMGISFIQIYSSDQTLVYSSRPINMRTMWDRVQTEAVLKINHGRRSQLAAVGITRVPQHGAPRYYLVMGSLLGRNFINELSHLTGLKTRLYYRDGDNYLDMFSGTRKGKSFRRLPAGLMKRLQSERKPYYSVKAEDADFRGQYTPIIDNDGQVEAVIFNGLKRAGYEEVLTSRLVLFSGISLIGVVFGAMTGYLLSRLVVRPVEHLRDGVMQLSAQNFNATVPVTSDDEVGDLAKAFNAMAVSLREARDEQQQRFHRDKLAALGELSASLAHEIRNPIGVINSASALMEKPELSPQKKADLLRMIREESVRVGSLVQDFLQLSRHRHPESVRIDPFVPLKRALDAVLAGTSNIEVRERTGHGTARIMADAGLLQQAWANILTNALQAMGESGGELNLVTEVDGGQVTLSVEDSGPGIPAEVMPRLFEPFFTTKERGTGLGLSLANTLVEVNGGRLRVLDPEKGGARFAMTFPVHD
ncbi:MAG: HAMP domain-containing sensor histidine kinase [Gammaproteobacteria bacterium]|nr:HAMP domain-containing sensor histidine kinase [Gammaproteobacteria bacterium]